MPRLVFLLSWSMLLLAQLAGAAEPVATTCHGEANCFAQWGVGKPVLKPLRIGRIYGWRKLDATHGVLWLGVEEPYLVVLEEHCAGLSEPVHLEASHPRHLTPGRDRLQGRVAACRIERLYELDNSRVVRPEVSPPQPAEAPLAPPATSEQAQQPTD